MPPSLLSLLAFFFFGNSQVTATHKSPLCNECSNDALSTSSGQVRAGYWLPSSELYYPLSRINTSLYTHLYYSISLNNTDFTVAGPPGNQLRLASFSSTLKSRNSSLKTLLSISSDSLAFSSMANNATLRAAFISSTEALADACMFDGLDLAWEYPSSVLDMANYGQLLREWRAHINEVAKDSRLLLTATVYFSDHIFDGSPNGLDYPVDAIAESLDWANVICYNYHRGGLVTAADAALYDSASHLSSSYGIVSWLDASLPPNKLVMGIPLFGRSWFLKNKLKNGTGASAVAAGSRQRLTNHTGIMGYFEIKNFLRQNNVEFVHDSQRISAYFQAGDLWVSFDSSEVVEDKIAFAFNNGLHGYFLWPISYDDENSTISTKAAEAWLSMRSAASRGLEVGDNSDGAYNSIQSPPPDSAPPASFATANICLHGFRLFQLLYFVLLFILH